MLNRVTNSIFHADKTGEYVVSTINNLFSPPITLVSSLFESIQNIELEQPKESKNEITTLTSTVLKVKDIIIRYHASVLQRTEFYSGIVEENLYKGIKFILIPFRCTKTTNALRELIAHKLASLIKIIMFCALQVYHAIPYLIAAAVTSGSMLLYYTSPVAVIAIFTGSVLLIHLYQTHLLVQQGRALELLMDKKSDELRMEIGNLNFVSLITSTLKRPINFAYKIFIIFKRAIW